jgi:hypothetical protein
VTAVTCLSKFDGSFASPVVLECDDGREWVTKAPCPSNHLVARTLVPEQVVARLAALIDAPVPESCLVQLPDALVATNVDMSHMLSGIAHGSLYQRDCGGRMGVHNVCDENRPRFASLNLLYSWTVCNDMQWIYEAGAPHLVHSVDHGHFFPSGPDWTAQTLRSAGNPQPVADFSMCGLVAADYAQALKLAEALAPWQIAAVVASPDESWGCTMDERIAIADFLYRRRPLLLDVFGRL